VSAVVQTFEIASIPEAEAERRRALCALLQTPLMPAVGETAAAYALVRRHFTWLKNWLAKFPEWSLSIDQDVARLRKSPADLLDETRPAVDATSGSAFSRRRYALLCLALAALERSERQTTLGKVAESIVEFVAADPDLQAAGLVFDISNHDQRRDLVHAVRLLLELGLLRRIDGDEQLFLQRTGAADALYEIDRAILSVMLNISQSPSALEAAGKLESPNQALQPRKTEARLVLDEPAPATEEANDRRIRARLMRTLLDDPVLYFHDLNREERAYFERHRGYLIQQIREATGLVPEIRHEGIAMVDDSGNLTDLRLPEEGTDGHAASLLAAWLAEQMRKSPGNPIPFEAVEQYLHSLIQIHGPKWRKAVTNPGAETQLAEDALWRLRALRLVRITSDGVVPLAAIGRYALSDTEKP
jgi:uncharacterized protein (TIGR02678 family)